MALVADAPKPPWRRRAGPPPDLSCPLIPFAFRLSPFASRLTFHESFACGALRSVGTARLAQLSADRVEMYQVKSMLDVIGHDDVGIVLRIEM